MRCKGNALFLILVAVALFAALAYAVTSSGRGGSSSATRENMSLAFAEFQRHVAMHQTAFTRMRLSGVSDARLDARRLDDWYMNTDCTASDASTPADCQVYHPDGGNLPIHPKMLSSVSWVPDSQKAAYGELLGFPMYQLVRVATIPWNAQDTNLEDIVLYFPTNRDFCVYYNSQIGVTADPDLTPTNVAFDFLNAGWSVRTADSDWGGYFTTTWASHLLGKSEGCWATGAGTGTYAIASVIVAR